MKIVLSVVTIVTLIATTGADVPEYSESALRALKLSNPESEKITAKLINAKVPATFKRGLDVEVGAVSLFMDSRRNLAVPAGDHPLCGNFLGIEFPDERTEQTEPICKVDLIRVRFLQTQNTNDDSLSMSVRFAINTRRPVVLEVPLFKTPSQYAQDSAELKAWAADKKVGIVSPFDLEDLDRMREGDDVDVTIDFTWLDALLTHGLSKRLRPVNLTVKGLRFAAESYVSSPLLLPDNILEELKSLLTWDADDKNIQGSMQLELEGR